MSNPPGDHDMLDKMECITEEEVIDEDDDSFDAEAIFEGSESMGTGGSPPEASERDDIYFERGESIETEGSSLYMVGDDEEFYDEDRAPGPLEFQWTNPGGASFEESGEDPGGACPRRNSYSAPRRASYASSGATSSQDSHDESHDDRMEPRRSAGRQVARRRQSVKLSSFRSNSSSFGEDGVTELPSTTIVRNFRQPFSRLSTLRSSRSGGSSQSLSGRRTSHDAGNYAITSLGEVGDFDNVAAAAAVVALGTGPSPNKRMQYAVNDTVLVFLNIMNHTNTIDSPESFTIAPVNKHGFPSGEGKSHGEQEGPFVYVMATVKRVHFNEDVPYYTVIREDTGTEQRADVAWMEPLTAMHGIEAATRAAHQTGQSAVQMESSHREADGISAWFVSCLLMPLRFAKNTLVPCYRVARATTKEQVTLLLFGDSPYYCRVRMTGINILVMCSFIYLFIEVVALAFLPPSWDFTVAVIGVIVWCILALELIFEWMIRPNDYFQLIMSDKAYAPSTARSINGFHLVAEAIALALFIPEFDCLYTRQCGKRVLFSGVDAALCAVFGPFRHDVAYGRLCIGLTILRIFGLLRHWKTMWINRTFSENSFSAPLLFMKLHDESGDDHSGRRLSRKTKARVEGEEGGAETESKSTDEEDKRLRMAATIGTALMVVNSHRALILLVIIVTVFPIINSMVHINKVAPNMVKLLQQNNLMLSEANETSCSFLQTTIEQWIELGATAQTAFLETQEVTLVLWAQLLPVRCDFQRRDGVITICAENTTIDESVCTAWSERPLDPDDATPEYYANALGLRVGGITEYQQTQIEILTYNTDGDVSMGPANFTIKALVNENHSISFVFFAEFLLLLSILTLCLFGLAVLRSDARRLVLGPLQRMLKIVVRYAKNPLAQTVQRKKRRHKRGSASDTGNENELGDPDKDNDNEELGNYETEQLINAIAKIADLLRKCWGVAGAGIISSNLARTQDGMTVVFNPTVPGKRVYALFGFVAIDGFSHQLVALDRDVMILINDVAKVVHDEVFRWALGDSGQCNKNLGSSFLMVFRIGDFTEVHERKARATDVVFSSSEKRSTKSKTLRRRGRGVSSRGRPPKTVRYGSRLDACTDDTLQLASLPGIQSFSDRALLGLLKSFAGIYRDRHLQNWKKDFRLGAGVGAFTVNIIIGMDAGWAVEGAVGSEYKIDATYLSPHVNMASRMMSAAKQYGVTILLSQAVEELLSAPARGKLRHLDTVYVKGSSVAQRVFTYDARHQGVDFFLFERPPEQADMDAESYSPAIWDTDQDLRAMRQHVTGDFQTKFMEGIGRYLSGKWKAAIAALQEADNIMITTVLEEGFIDYNPDEEIDERLLDRRNTDDEVVRLRNELGDGACKCLISYMERRGGIPPKDWNGVRPLTSK